MEYNMILENYNVTRQEIDYCISMLDISKLQQNIVVENDKEVYLDGKLWYIENEKTTTEKEKVRQLENRIMDKCLEYFADRLIIDEAIKTPAIPEIEPTVELSTQETIQAEILLSQMEILQNQASQEEILATILLNQMEV